MGERMTTGLVDIATPDITIGGLASHDLDPQITEWVKGSSGIDPQFSATIEVKPKIGFKTYDLGTALAICGVGGCAFTDFDLYELLYDDHGEIKAGAVHPKTTLDAGIMIPTEMSFGGGEEPVTVGFEAYATASDGLTLPISQALAAIPAGGALGNAYTLQSIKFKGTTILEITNLSWAFGLTVDHKVTGGDIVPRKAPITARQAVLSATSEDNTVRTVMDFTATQGALELKFVKLSPTGRGAGVLTIAAANASGKLMSRSGQDGQATGIPFELRPIKGVAAVYTIASA